MTIQANPRWGIVALAGVGFFASALLISFGGGTSWLMPLLWGYIGWHGYKGNLNEIKLAIKVYVILIVLLSAFGLFIDAQHYLPQILLVSIFSVIPNIFLFDYVNTKSESETNFSEFDITRNDAYKKENKVTDSSFFTNDESFYEQAYDEFHSNKRKKGLYLKLLTNNDGIKEKTEYEYIKTRVKEFKDEIKYNRFNKQSQLKTLTEEERDSLRKIQSSKFTEGYIEGIKCLLFETGEAAIEISKGKYRIYEDEDSMRKSAIYYRSMGLYLGVGYVKTITLTETRKTKKTTTLTCRKCSQKFRITNETKMVECSNCGRKWLHEQI